MDDDVAAPPSEADAPDKAAPYGAVVDQWFRETLAHTYTPAVTAHLAAAVNDLKRRLAAAAPSHPKADI